jgi:basic membrane protein A
MTATALAAGSMIASAAEGEPALLIDLGGKFDKSFNEAAWTGAEKWKDPLRPALAQSRDSVRDPQ